MSETNNYGWHPDLPDQRDYLFSKYIGFCGKVKPKKAQVDLRSQCPEVYNQGALGSCTANAVGGMFQFVDAKEGAGSFMPSRLFIYYNEREMEGSVAHDAGAYIRDGMKSISKQGVCPETQWPYHTKDFAIKPKAECYTEALKHQSIEYMRVGRSLAEMRECLSQGYPFVYGFTVYESFESSAVARTGIVPMPGKKEKVLGGHAVMAVGYTDKDKMMLVRNSWGTGWGEKGYFWMPYDYFTNSNLSDDFWTIRKVEQ